MDTTDVQTGGAGDRRRDLRPLAALKPYLLRYPLVLVGAMLALVVSAAAMLSVPIAARGIIDTGFKGAGDGAFITLIFLGVLIAAASSARFYFINWLGERVVADVRRDVFEHLTRLGAAFFEKTHSGEMMSRLTADTTQIKAAAGMTLSQALRNTIMLVGAVVMMVLTSIELSGVVLLAIPLIVLPLVGYGRIVRNRSRAAQDSLAKASAYAAENLAAVRTMQAFGFEGEVARRFRWSVDEAFEAARSRLVARAGLTAMTMFLVVASVVCVLWFGAGLVVAGKITGGELAQFMLYALFAAGALGELSEVWGEVQQAAGASERLMELVAIEPEIASPAEPVCLPRPVAGRITFENVSFRYPSRTETAALDCVSFTVEPGETVAIVGPSGAGKSTVFSLILRFFDPTEGRVCLDGVATSSADLAELRGALALVPQDVAVFAGTVAQNIRYGSLHASDEAVVKAAVAAQADGFIRAMPDGYDTVLGERGVQLSGGQRQRIAIARAILKGSPVLLLDEATSALDADSEAGVQKALDAVMAGRTTLVIAHRLATIRKADRILVMDGGRIIEVGTHQTLQRAGGLYARLAALQFRDRAEEAEAAE